MKGILQIAGNELGKFCYSRVAWLVVIVFMVQVGYAFCESILKVIEYSNLNTTSSRNGFTTMVFGLKRQRVFEILYNNVYLYVPLLSMGLISNELGSGTIKLLLSSPVSIVQLVFGKFMAMVGYALVLVSIILGFGLLGAVLIADFQWMPVMAGLIGGFLLIVTYASIGLFISSLTKYQVVAGLCTFGMLIVLDSIGSWGQEVPVINEIFYWLSIAGRAEEIMKGLLTSGGVIYFFVMTGLFIAFTIFRLSLLTGHVSMKTGLVRLMALVILAGVIGTFSAHPRYNLYKDFTPTKKLTLSKEGQAMAVQLGNEPLVLKTYVNILSSMAPVSGLPKHHNVDYREFDRYTRFVPDLKIEHVYFYDTVDNPGLYKAHPGLSQRELAAKVAKAYGLNMVKVLAPDEIRKKVDLTAEGNEYVRVLEYGERKAFLRMFTDNSHYPSDVTMLAALKSILTDPPIVGILQGNGERKLSKKDRDYYWYLESRKDFRYSLLNSGIQFEEIHLEGNRIPNHIDILLLADPGSPYDESSLIAIQKFIDSGKDLLVLGEPDSAPFLNPLCGQFGINIGTTKLQSNSREYSADLIFAEPTACAIQLTSDALTHTNMTKHAYVPLLFSTVAPLAVTSRKDFESFPFVRAKPSGLLSMDSIDVNGVLGIALSRQVGDREQRIAILGDADFLSNKEFFRLTRNRNMNLANLVHPVFSWLTHDSFPVAESVQHEEPGDNQVAINTNSLNRLRILLLLILPSALLLLSGIFLLKRKSY